MANAKSPEPSTLIDTISDAVSDGARYLADLAEALFRRITNSLQWIAPLVLGSGLAAGCSSEDVDAAVAPPPKAEPTVVAPAEPPNTGPKAMGKFNVTFYYTIGEDEVAAKAAKTAAKLAKTKATKAANDNTDAVGETAAIVVPETVTIYEGGSCEPIADVTKDFAAQLALQGSGKLKDGRVVNIWGRCGCGRSPCFKVSQTKWGTAGNGRALTPFRTIAVDPKVIKLGSLLHVPVLEGLTMPGRPPWGGFVHDGCVVADDTGGGIKGNQLDLFVGRRGMHFAIAGRQGSHAWARNVPVFDGSKICERVGRKVARKAGAI